MLKKIFLLSIFSVAFLGFIHKAGADEISELKEKVRITQKRIKQLESGKKNQVSSSPKDKWKTNVRGNYYWDTREFNTFSLITSTTGLPYGLSVWGFVDLHGDQHEPQLNIKLNERFNFITEYRYSGFEDANAALNGEGVAFGMSMVF